MMNTIDVKTIPESFKHTVSRSFQGTVAEASYTVRHYIDPSRSLVTSGDIDCREAGRRIAQGDPILKKCNVYLPAGYDHSDTQYDVLYLLHGVGGNRFEWLNGGEADGHPMICNLLDNLIAKGEIDPLIVVFPNGRSAHDWTDCTFNPAGTNLLGFYYFDYELRYDLIPFIESTFRTRANIRDTSSEGIAANRLHRAIGGLSMGGMQCLNLILGGFRCDATQYTGVESPWANGLHETVPAPGMLDLFAYVGAFSNAPTTSDGSVLGNSIASCGHKLDLLYITCGDADAISYEAGYAKAENGLADAAGACLGLYCLITIKSGLHDFNVWHNGAYHFIRMAFGRSAADGKQHTVRMTLDSY